MEHKIKVLILEDLISDAELAEREVKAVLKNYTVVVTDTEQGFIKALENFKPDLIISDYMLPAFNGMKALQITRKKEEFIPFIILTGSMNEETAVECLKAGADDYVIKEHIKRLGPSIINALDKKEIRQERKRAEKALKESEEKYAELIENMTNAVAVLKAVDNGKGFIIQDFNKAGEKIENIKREELIGKKVTEIFPTLKESELLKVFQEVWKTGKPQFFPRSIYKDNMIISWQDNYVYKLSSGEIVIIYEDITERKQAEKALKESEEKYRKIFENVQDIFYQVDTEGNIIEISPSIKRYSGYSREELIGTPVSRTYYNPNNRLLLMAELEKKGEVVDYEIRLKTKSDRFIYVSLNAHILYDENKKPAGIEGSLRDITERKQAKETIIQQNEFLNNVLESLTYPFYIVDINDYSILKANSESGLNLALNKTTCHALTHNSNVPCNDQEHPCPLEIVKKTRKSAMVEHIHIDKAGNIKNVEVYCYPIFDKEGTISSVIEYSLDVTERKQAVKELTKLSTAVTQSPSVITITDTKGNLEYVNPKFTEITGYSLEEAIGQNPRVLKSGEQPYEFYKEFWKTISSGNVWRGEFHNKKKNGELFWESASISPIFDEQGKIINYIKVAEDITEHKRNEQIQSIIHNISNAVITGHNLEKFLILVKEELGKLIDTTNFFVALYDDVTDRISLPFHHDEKDSVEFFPAGKTLTNYVIKTKKPLLAQKAMIQKLIKSGEVEQVGHLSKVWLGVPLKNENKVTGLIAVQSYDNENAYNEADVKMLEIISYQISLSLERVKAEEDLKFAKEKAEESNRLKTAFLNNMSHEIRTPLNGITGFIGLLQDSEIDDNEKQEFFDIINKNSDRLIATVTDIMDISRIEAGEVKVSKSEVSVNEILEEQYKFFYQEAKSKGIELNYKPSLSDSESRIITDKYKLEGILTNLIKNAIKYTDTGSIVFGYNINTLEKKEFFEFYVKDTGIGIPANRIDAIFNRFEQADIGDTRAFQGSGLGLSIAKSYIEMLGGKISVKSKEAGGSTFTFTIPYTKKLEKESEAKVNINKEPQKSLSHISLIIAEDDETSRLLYETIFRGNKIIFTTTGQETIEKSRENPSTDIILMDIQMPDMNGYDATREIRKFNTDVVIIAQTAYGLAGDREKAIDAGCNDYISKPIIKEILFEKMRAWLD